MTLLQSNKIDELVETEVEVALEPIDVPKRLKSASEAVSLLFGRPPSTALRSEPYSLWTPLNQPTIRPVS